MNNKFSREKLFKTIGIVCIFASAFFYILPMVIGNNLVFLLGIITAVIGIVMARKSDNAGILVLNVIVLIVIVLELFMRVRDGYSGTGWYYFHLLQHPEDNIWN